MLGGSNQAFGWNREYAYRGTHQGTYYNGQLLGDILSIATGVQELVLGLGGGLTITGVGAVPGVFVIAGSTTLVVHGTSVIVLASKNLINGLFNRTHDNMHGNGGGGGGNYKLIKGNKEANKIAKKLGYKDAHALKKEYVGSDGPNFDIFVDRSTGKVQLRNKDQTKKVFVLEIVE